MAALAAHRYAADGLGDLELSSARRRATAARAAGRARVDVHPLVAKTAARQASRTSHAWPLRPKNIEPHANAHVGAFKVCTGTTLVDVFSPSEQPRTDTTLDAKAFYPAELTRTDTTLGVNARPRL